MLFSLNRLQNVLTVGLLVYFKSGQAAGHLDRNRFSVM